MAGERCQRWRWLAPVRFAFWKPRQFAPQRRRQTTTRKESMRKHPSALVLSRIEVRPCSENTSDDLPAQQMNVFTRVPAASMPQQVPAQIYVAHSTLREDWKRPIQIIHNYV